MTTFYTVVSWLVILGYWVLIAGVTLRILMKRRAVPSRNGTVVNHLYPSAGRDHRLFVRGRIAFRQTSRRACPRHVAVYRQMVE